MNKRDRPFLHPFWVQKPAAKTVHWALSSREVLGLGNLAQPSGQLCFMVGRTRFLGVL